MGQDALFMPALALRAISLSISSKHRMAKLFTPKANLHF